MPPAKRRPANLHPLDADDRPVRALLLLRQSDSRGQGAQSLSLDSQDTILHKRAAEANWGIVGVIREPDIKGWQEVEDRPGLSEAIRRAKEREFDVILVYTIDRLFRSVRIQEQVLFDLEKMGVRLVSVMEPHVSEPLYRQLIGAIAEQQTRTISAHVRRAFAERARRGFLHGPLPYGYQVAPLAEDKSKQPPIPNPETAPVAEEILRRFAAGDGPTVIADDLTQRGIPSPTGLAIWRVQSVMATIRSPAYAGYVQVNGERHEGLHAPLIDRETWAVIEKRLAAGRRTPRKKAVSSWLEGLVLHACGRRAYLMPPTRPGTPEPYFRCKAISHKELGECTLGRWIYRTTNLERLTRQVLITDLANLQTDEGAIAAIRDEARRTVPLADRRRREVMDRRARALARRAKAEELYLSGTRDRAWFDAQEAHIAAELAACDEALAELPVVPDVDGIRALRRELLSAQAIIRHAEPPELRGILAAVGMVVYGPTGVWIAYKPAVAAMLIVKITTLAP